MRLERWPNWKGESLPQRKGYVLRLMVWIRLLTPLNRITSHSSTVSSAYLFIGIGLMELAAYNAFIRYGKSSKWCKSHSLSFPALSRAISIRSQLKKYMSRFGLPTESCEGDAKRLQRCLVSGLWRNGARWAADGTYRSVRGNVVSQSTFNPTLRWI